MAPAERLRHRAVPFRRVEEKLIVARPVDGTPVVLAATAAFVWSFLDDWSTLADVEESLASTYSDVPALSRTAALEDIVTVLDGEGLLDRG